MRAGDADLLGRSTVIEIVHEQGGRLIAAERQCAHATLDAASEAELRRWVCARPTIPTGCRRTKLTTTAVRPGRPRVATGAAAGVGRDGLHGCDASPPVLREEPRRKKTRW